MTRLRRAVLAGALLAVTEGPALAALNVCNRTSYILYVATARPEAGPAKAKTWRVKGWTRVTPGLCVAALPAKLTGRTYMVRAHSGLAHSGPERAWGGKHDLCVRGENFSLSQQAGGQQAGGEHADAERCPGGFPRGFAAITTGGRADWTVTFDQSPPIASLARAELAGVRRLLKDDGYKVGPLTGAPDKITGDALAAFRKTLPPEADNAALFTALEDQARKRVAPAGVTACNEGPAALLLALGQSGQGGHISRGWWTVAPGACARPQTTPLTGKGLAVLARTKDGRTVKGGAQKLCVRGQAFQIRDADDNCAARGFRTAGFAPVQTHGAAGVIVHLGGAVPSPGIFVPGIKARPHTTMLK